MPVTVTVRNSASCRTLSLGVLSYYSLIHQTTKTFYVIIDECVLDEVKLVFLRVIHMNVNNQTVNNKIKRNKQKELIEQDGTHARTRKHTLTCTGTEGIEINLRICGDI
jgi:hypothetical protein